MEKIHKQFNCYDMVPFKTPFNFYMNVGRHARNRVSQSDYAKIIKSLTKLMNSIQFYVAYASIYFTS